MAQDAAYGGKSICKLLAAAISKVIVWNMCSLVGLGLEVSPQSSGFNIQLYFFFFFFGIIISLVGSIPNKFFYMVDFILITSLTVSLVPGLVCTTS